MRLVIVPASEGQERRGIVASQQRASDLRMVAKGKGPQARVAGMVLSQMRGERIRPL